MQAAYAVPFGAHPEPKLQLGEGNKQRRLRDRKVHAAAELHVTLFDAVAAGNGTADERGAKRWQMASETFSGSWWPDFADWLAQRGGDRRPAPTELGGDGLVALAPAPGTYVYER